MFEFIIAACFLYWFQNRLEDRLGGVWMFLNIFDNQCFYIYIIYIILGEHILGSTLWLKFQNYENTKPNMLSVLMNLYCFYFFLGYA